MTRRWVAAFERERRGRVGVGVGVGVAFVLATTVFGCSAARPNVAAPPSVTALPPPKVAQGSLEASAVLAEAPSKAAQLGAGPHAVVVVTEGVDGERVGGFVEIPQELCLLAYARGAASVEDLDLAAFSDEGMPIVVDESPDAHPTVVLCPPHPGRVYLSAHVASGEGLVAIAAHLVSRDRAADVSKAFGARGGGDETPRPADGWPGIDDIVRAHRRALGGVWEEFRKVAVMVDPRAPTYVTLPIEADQCVDAVVLPDSEVGSIEVEAVDAEGRLLARARDAGRNRAITLCSSIATDGSLMVRPHSGRGLAAVILARARGAVARDLSARADVVWTTSSLPLDAARSAWNAELARAGYSAGSVLASGTLAAGRREGVAIAPSRGSACTRIDVVAGAPLTLVHASLWEEAGGLVASDDGTASATLFSCTKKAARLEVETAGRPGPYAVLARPERWNDASFEKHPLAAARMLARATTGPKRVFEGAPVAVRAHDIDDGRRLSWDETVPAGACLTVAAGAQGEGTGLGLRLIDPETREEVDRSFATHDAAVRACATGSGAARPLRVELRVTAGRLSVVVGVRAAPVERAARPTASP